MNEHPKRILLALDGSEQSYNAVEYAAEILAPGAAFFVLFHVLPTIPDIYYDLDAYAGGRAWIHTSHAWFIGQKKQMEDFMKTARAALVRAGHPEENITVNIQDKKVGIARDIAYEVQSGYDAVVLGRTGVSRIKDIVLGSVANKLLGRVSGTSVWFIGGKPNPGKILIAVDPSEGAQRAAEAAVSMGRGSEAEYILLHVQRGLMGYSPVMVEARMTVENEELQKKLREHQREQLGFLDHLKARVIAEGAPPDKVRTHFISDVYSRAEAIVDYAVKNDIGTIVVGRRGLSRVQEFFMGRVGYKVMQLANKSAVWVVA
ncbi:universal stress protein [Desulfatibacillum aliphaticivorans]|uniref:universal stress protein n=1 Tax=Desulfatibacillum aliphaticivorans TaxID=218208 RepID=UPI00040F59B4|nr:universal stress protein [Desulfatibacillum aliphaticivorans]